MSQLPTGEQLRIEGVEANLAAASAPHRPFLHHAEIALARFIREGRRFTAEDIRDEIPEGIEPHHHNVIGSMLSHASQRGDIVPVGVTRATRRSRHSSRNCIWIATKAIEGTAA